MRVEQSVDAVMRPLTQALRDCRIAKAELTKGAVGASPRVHMKAAVTRLNEALGLEPPPSICGACVGHWMAEARRERKPMPRHCFTEFPKNCEAAGCVYEEPS